MTTTQRTYPTRVNVTFQQKRGQVAVDQIRAVDRQRLVRKLGIVPSRVAEALSSVLVDMFTRTYKAECPFANTGSHSRTAPQLAAPNSDA